MNAERRTVLVALVPLVPCLCAMGMMGDPPARTRVPETPQRFDAVITDLDEATVRVTEVSYDGQLYLPVYRGKGLITIPFSKITRIDFGEREGGQRQARITFRNREAADFRVETKVLFLGKLPFGTYQITVKDLKRLEFVQDGSTRAPESETPHAPDT